MYEEENGFTKSLLDHFENLPGNFRKVGYVLKIGERYFRSINKNRLQTAWSVPGAKVFLPHPDNITLQVIERILKERRLKFKRISIYESEN
jgi:hypothetical protein